MLCRSLSLQTLGFLFKPLKGRLSFDTKIFLKIYLYGYVNGLLAELKAKKDVTRNIRIGSARKTHKEHR
jgi:transposase